MMLVGLTQYLILGTLLFGVGLLGIIIKRNAIAILMSVELMLNAVNINFIAINKFVAPAAGVGQLFAVFVIVVAAAEVAVGLALIIAMYKKRKTVELDEFDLLKL